MEIGRQAAVLVATGVLRLLALSAAHPEMRTTVRTISLALTAIPTTHQLDRDLLARDKTVAVRVIVGLKAANEEKTADQAADTMTAVGSASLAKAEVNEMVQGVMVHQEGTNASAEMNLEDMAMIGVVEDHIEEEQAVVLALRREETMARSIAENIQEVTTVALAGSIHLAQVVGEVLPERPARVSAQDADLRRLPGHCLMLVWWGKCSRNS